MRYVPLVVLLLCVLWCCQEQSQSDKVLYSDVDTTVFSIGDTVTPFGYIDPLEKGWRVVIEPSGAETDSKKIKVSKRLATARPAVLKLFRDWKFIYESQHNQGVTSTILVYKDGTLVDQQGIVLSDSVVGLQSIKFGWIRPADRAHVYKSIRLMDERPF